ncbi:phosphoribosylanthranilate isomerase [Subsaxibacter sp. CAU 1640]|uniref:phosphoribosylanthranilate isomerase n=1 Tax=Subsaxibacter sp. CAU 1640 TaxID=2933271 RepID=UPI002004E964|nr:phosphoribosylanthranilate isomerase [Subsaxibacter sp. CAU 1640]MCK7591465.1 phosphoribosylanthranilate isomerase [Subsaxibacter sp. CAU 1640]
MKLKVCGMTSEKNILEVAQLQPEYLGFIFYEKSARYFNRDIPNLPKEIKKVGVFVNAPIEFILEKITAYGLNVIQLHGSESAEFCKDLKRHFEEQIDDNNTSEIKRLPRYARNDVIIIKVFSVDNQFDSETLQPYESVCDYYLFDTKGKLPGGNGFTFDWTVLKNYPSSKPFFLSGGIGLEQLDDLKSFLQTKESQFCNAIDVNSKFEIEPGLKDVQKLELFKEKIKSL